MQKSGKEQLFLEYPKYPNFDELIASDLLVMPFYKDSFNGWQQDIFQVLKTDYENQVVFYSEEPDLISVRHNFSAPDPMFIVELGLLIVNSVQLMGELHKVLKNKLPGKTFKIKHAISTDDGYEIIEFEGNIDDYKEAIEKIRSRK